MFDADALAQLLIAGQQSLLHQLRDQFDVRPYLMSEVEVELLSNRRIGGLVKPVLEKALRHKWIKILSASELESLGTEVTLKDIRDLAAEYALHVQTGEAHTHAAAILLDCPCVSNDMNAVRVLEANGKTLPPVVLRCFDIFGFAVTEQLADVRAMETARTTLLSRGEGVPACMKNASFEDGLPGLACRLTTSMAATTDRRGWNSTFYLQRSAGKDES